MVKNLPANAGDLRDKGSILESGRSPEEGYSNSLQYSCLENPKDRGAYRATVDGVAKSQTRLRLTFHFSTGCAYSLNTEKTLTQKKTIGGFSETHRSRIILTL